MKVTRRSENGKSGHLLISVLASRVAEVEAVLTFCGEALAARVACSHRPHCPSSTSQRMTTDTACG